MAASPAGIYRPRRPQSSPLYRLLQDHFEELAGAYEERFEHLYGPWRPVVREVVEKYLDCGNLELGFARVRCEECGAEFLVAFSCKCRYFCPSCHAKRLAIWCDWLENRSRIASTSSPSPSGFDRTSFTIVASSGC